MKNIAILNLGFIGDVINSSPVCKELKKAYPESNLIFITNSASKTTAKCLPGVDEVFVYDRTREKKSAFDLIKTALSLKVRLDKIIILDNSLRSAFFAFLTGAKERIGRVGQGRSLLLTKKIPFTQEEKNMQIHVSEHYMRVLKPLKLYKEDYSIGFNYLEEDLIFAKNLLLNNNIKEKKLIGLCPCARLEGKNWWPEQAAEFIKLINERTDKKVVLLGDKSCSNFRDELLKKLDENDFVDLVEQTSITQLAALISLLEKVVTVDTGTMHLAFAVGVPSVCLFYYDCITKWGPRDINQNKVIFSEDRHGIEAKRVFEKLELI